jgi:hypothetical protein
MFIPDPGYRIRNTKSVDHFQYYIPSKAAVIFLPSVFYYCTLIHAVTYRVFRISTVPLKILQIIYSLKNYM